MSLYSQNDKTEVSRVWVADNGDGTYKNPILYADYSDPDIERVGDDYYMIASSFNCVPGIPILHSKDLVNWKIIGYGIDRQKPFDVFDKPQHGNGVWAPSIRFHKGEFYIYYPDPDYGIYVIKAKNPAGPWSDPVLIKAAKGWIDPCPLWDEDGRAWLVSALAGSRAGAKSVMIVSKMNDEGTKLLDDGVIVYDGHQKNPTIEGPKFYKRNGYYYISAPAGGVPTGWQLILRSKNVYGPYEEKIVLDQGKTIINGPHQGGWVQTQSGEYWFIHFQDKDAYGRIINLEPMKWVNDWPVIGVDPDGDGKGEPVLTYKKPNVGKSYPICTPLESDEFNQPGLGLQWQWHANPQPNWAFTTGALGYLRLICIPQPASFVNFWDIPNLLLQKFPAPEFMVTARMTFNPLYNNEKTGLIIMGQDYSYISVKQSDNGLAVSQTVCLNAMKQGKEIEGKAAKLTSSTFFLRVRVREGAICQFSCSNDGKEFFDVGEPFKAKKGMWIGAKVGLFATRTDYKAGEVGYTDVDWFRIERNQ
ncbi:MAG: glycoside hydrolase 43 family protein [Bacteroidota bacterium]|nr:glycoside hydrolase 43 family protein [Bacteroidota bacterium]